MQLPGEALPSKLQVSMGPADSKERGTHYGGAEAVLKTAGVAGTRRPDGVERSSRSMDAESRPCPEIKKASGSFLELSGAGIRVPLLCCPQRQYKLQLTPCQI